MRRWAILTVSLYLVVLVLLTPPLLLFAGLAKSSPAGWEFTLTSDNAFRIYREWGYWVWTAVLVLGQALLLLVPIDIAQGRPARRRLFVPVITAALLFACIVTGAIFSLLCAVFGDKALNYLDTVSSAQAVQNPVAAQVMRQLGVGSGTGREGCATVGTSGRCQKTGKLRT